MTRKNKLVLLVLLMGITAYFSVSTFMKGHVNGPLMYASPDENPEYYWLKVGHPAALFLLCCGFFIWELRKK